MQMEIHLDNKFQTLLTIITGFHGFIRIFRVVVHWTMLIMTLQNKFETVVAI